ncbi:FHA domain-containing protein FhaB/FipA [Cellulomonas wangsupingiae]|uniref:FHA domain-containing protein n=1 Tax=Cellulomonas wangsupingiae TaxID=2968085 RepID=A0ABY5K7S7_9CELL|nr:FHA domain-containing protein [Cellulomonas wangsupingiae]MCC2333942.1 FHA domain-containing protein [Cellulomonas wangsupingiae]MCM0640995.1 FHA domain-containing protein [Cellulomonas wangsupingiae]UUI65197.1 FHA domain-containing protein [Cellulomonas wangsupingiae]
MSELTITLLRLGYLALLWFLVLSAITVLRRDLYGTRIIDRRRAPGKAAPAGDAPAADTPRAPRRSRSNGGPTRLVVTEGPLRGTTLPLGSSAVLVGRAPSCTLVLDDDYSSSRHARIFPQGDRWFVEDLGSTNGTFVGEQRVDQPTPVPTGTPVRVGQSLLELQR